MPSQPKSPYATSFRSALNRGIPAGSAVAAISKRTSKNPSQIFTSLHKSGLCDRQKLNGQWVYWPAEQPKKSASQAKGSQVQMWQHFIDWAIASGNCKPEQLERNSGSQNDFMSYCRKYFNRQISGSTSSPSSTRKSSRKSGTRKSSVRRTSSATRSYKFPQTRSQSRTRRAA